MANIYKLLTKEQEKGNTLITGGGDILSTERLEKGIKTDYMKGLKDGTISFDKPFTEYFNDRITNYKTVDDCINILLDNGVLKECKPKEETQGESTDKPG